MLFIKDEGARLAQRDGSVKALLLASSVLVSAMSGTAAAQSNIVVRDGDVRTSAANIDNSDTLTVEEGGILSFTRGTAVNIGFGSNNINVEINNDGVIESHTNNNSRVVNGGRNYTGTFNLTIRNGTGARIQSGFQTDPTTGLSNQVNGASNAIRLRDNNSDALATILIENDGIIRTTSRRSDGSFNTFTRNINIDPFGEGSTITLNNGENGFLEGAYGFWSRITANIDNAGIIKAIDSGDSTSTSEGIDLVVGGSIILRSTSLTSGNTEKLTGPSDSINFDDNSARDVNRLTIEAGAEIIGRISASSNGLLDTLELTVSDDSDEPMSDTLGLAVNFDELVVSGGDWTITNAFDLTPPDPVVDDTTGATTVPPSVSGATIDSGASLTLGAGASIVGTVSNSGTLGFGQGGMQTLDPTTVITGSGSVLVTNGTELTINTAEVYTGDTVVGDGSLQLDGSLAGGVQVSEGTTLTGTGSAAGSAQVSGTISPAGPDVVGTLTLGGLDLTPSATIQYDAGAPDIIAASDRIQVNGNVTLDGEIDVNDVGGFGEGVYRIIDYTGTLTDNGLEIGMLPDTFLAFDTEVQTVNAGQVNLVVDRDGRLQFFDGTDLVADGNVDGGAGSFNLTTTNFTNFDGTSNAAFGGEIAVFQNAGGIVTVDDNIAFEILQFTDDGYDLVNGTGSLTLGADPSSIRVDEDITASISANIGGTGALSKVGNGTLELGGTNTFSGSTNVEFGTLNLTGSVANGVVVSDNATLGGDGTVNGVTTVMAGVIAPGDNGVGTLTTGNLILNEGSVLQYELGTPDVLAASDRIQVNGNLTLDGTFNATDVGNFGDGVYRLIDYTGTLTDNGLEVGDLPGDVLPSQRAIQVSQAGQINLIVATEAPAIQFFDGMDVLGDRVIDGGDGVWDLTTTNWTDANGELNNVFGENFAVFTGAAGTVTVEDDLSFSGIQFITDGYVIEDGGGSLTIVDNFRDDSTDVDENTNFRVDPSVTATINAEILGTNSLTKLDAGTLVLGGDSTYSGETFVAGGTLQVNGSVTSAVTVQSGGTLSGTGLLGGLTVDGTLSTGVDGLGQITVNGLTTFNAGSIFDVELTSDGDGDVLGVQGSTVINGGDVAITYADGDYGNATVYTILGASAVQGTFDSITDNLDNVDSFLQYNGIRVEVVALRNDVLFSQFGTTANQIAVGTIFDGTPTNGVLTRALLFAEQDEAVAVLDELSGEAFAVTLDHIVRSAHEYRRPFVDRMSEPVEAGVVVWGELGVGKVEFDAQTGFAGYDVDRSSYASGLEFGFGETSKIGAGVNWVEDNIEIIGRDGAGTLQAITAFGYGSFDLGGLAIRLGGGYSFITNEIDRSLAFFGINEQVSSDEEGSQVQVYGELAYGFGGEAFRVEPFIGGSYSKTDLDGFSEVGGQFASVAAAGVDVDQTVGTAGARAFGGIGPHIYIEGEAAVDKYFGDTPATRLLNLGNLPGSFTVAADERDDVLVRGSVGFGFELGAGRLGFSGTGAKSGDVSEFGGQVSLDYSF